MILLKVAQGNESLLHHIATDFISWNPWDIMWK